MTVALQIAKSERKILTLVYRNKKTVFHFWMLSALTLKNAESLLRFSNMRWQCQKVY